MTRKQALDIGELLTRAWPRGPGLLVWRDTLERHCEHDPALVVAHQYIDTSEQAPSVSGYLATYRRHIGRHDVRTGDRCPTCEGTGMRSARQLIGGVEHPVVVACAECNAGIGAARVLTAIDTANAQANSTHRRDHGPVIVMPTTPADDGPVMSVDEYLTLLTTRANIGVAEAGEMLDIWAENLARRPFGARP